MGAEAEERVAEANYVALDFAAAADGYERAFAAYRKEGNVRGAGRVARMIGWVRGNIQGDWAVSGGWNARACAVLEEAPEGSAERGWIEIILAAPEPDLSAKERRARTALDIGRRSGDIDLEIESLGWLGLSLVFADRVEEGMALMDQALTAVCTGEVTELFVIEGTFCAFFWLCERTHDVARAEQWIRTAEEMVKRRGLSAMGAFCRVHYGGILTMAGRWPEAESELAGVAEMFAGTNTRMRSKALVRLADLRVRQGRLEEAELLLDGLDQDEEAARPLAALHLERHEYELARDRLERAIDREHIESTVAGPLLALLVDVHPARGAIPDARAAADRLQAIASRQHAPYLKAAAALAEGQLCIATATGDARSCLSQALAEFDRAQTPMELARTQLELARALTHELPEVAIAEAKRALEGFERLEAARHADEAAAMLRSLGAPVRTGAKGEGVLTKRESEVLALLGEGLSNPEIGDRLYIARKTVEHHVGSLLSKLGLRNRAEAAAYATRSKSSS